MHNQSWLIVAHGCFLGERMRLLCLLLLLVSSRPGPAAALSFHVAVEYPKAPECETFAQRSKSLIEEWYPRINQILFGPDHPLPTDSISLVCEPMKAIAYSDIQKNRIHISAAFVSTHPEDYGTVVHELSHLVQHYAKLKPEQVWLQEGIADYVRHKYFEQDIATLAVAVDPDHDTYRKGYRVTAAFLSWLEEHRSATIVQDLNRGCAAGHCTVDLFLHSCGKDVDTLWGEFVNDLKRVSPADKPHQVDF